MKCAQAETIDSSEIRCLSDAGLKSWAKQILLIVSTGLVFLVSVPVAYAAGEPCSLDAECAQDESCSDSLCVANDQFIQVQDLADDFTGSWKECLWTPYQRYGGDTHVEGDEEYDESLNSVVDSKLNLKIPANFLAGMNWETGLVSKYQLVGDFQMEMDFYFPTPDYWTNLDMRGLNALFVEVMANDAGTRRRHLRQSRFNPSASDAVYSPHLWVANFDIGRVTQIDTDNATLLGSYSVGTTPSRTSVDLLGNVWIHNRGSSNVTFIRSAECSPPHCTVAEVNNNYKETFNFPYHNGPNGGGVAVDRNNDPWVGFHNAQIVAKLNRVDGTVIEQVSVAGNPYGLALDRNDNLWISNRGCCGGISSSNLGKVDAATGTLIANYQPPSNWNFSPYGIAVDAVGKIWITNWTHDDLLRFDPVTEQWERFTGNTNDLHRGRGVAPDNQGRVWAVGTTYNRLSVYNQDTGAHMASYSTCVDPTGVALDRHNMVWVACMDNQVWQFDRNGNVLQQINTADGIYSYSDMTGYQLRNFASDAWQQDFLATSSDDSDSYYVNSIESNYGGGIEDGSGGNTSFDPNEAPFENLVTVGDNLYEVARFSLGDYYYTDRLFRIMAQPADLEASWGIKTPNDDRTSAVEEQLSFTVIEDATVYVALDSRVVELPAWISPAAGFNTTGEVIQTSDSATNLDLYSKILVAGEQVVLGGMDSETSVNYFVYVVPAIYDNPPPQNDLALIHTPEYDNLAQGGRLRVRRTGSSWEFFYRDLGSGADYDATRTWHNIGALDLGTQNVFVRLRTRLDPFWHTGSVGDPGGPINIQYDDFVVDYADGVVGGPVELCDGIDNTCNGRVDDTFPGDGSSCSTGAEGICSEGVLTCAVGWDGQSSVICEPLNAPRAERCNGLDDNCDGQIDNAIPISGQTAEGLEVISGTLCSTGLHGICSEGRYACQGGVMTCRPLQEPQPEVCNGLDSNCDGVVDGIADNMFSKIGRKLHVVQRSTPHLTPRPFDGEAGVSFEAFAQHDGTNSLTPEVHATRRARVVFYLDKSRADANDPHGKYVIWLTHGSTDPSQPAVLVTYSLSYQEDVPYSILLADGTVSNNISGANQKLQQFFIKSNEGETGGVGLGALNPSEHWRLALSADLGYGIDEWEIYNADDGSVVRLASTEKLIIENQAISDLNTFKLSAEDGKPCEVANRQGICRQGTAMCQNGALTCIATVSPQPEICDGRDNNCNGIIDGPIEELVFPTVMTTQVSSPGPDDWAWAPTVDTHGSARDFLNFQPRDGDDRMGSADVRTLEDPDISPQAMNRSMIMFHRDLRDGTISMPIIHGKLVSGTDGEIAAATTLRMRYEAVQGPLPNEVFSAWFDDQIAQGSTPADQVPSHVTNNRMDFDWTLHRWTENGQTHREADSVVLIDIFQDVALGGGKTASLSWRGSNPVGSGNIQEWEIYAPKIGSQPQNLDQAILIRVEARDSENAFCVRNDNPDPACNGLVSNLVCIDGQIQCGQDIETCCSPEHPLYDQECDGTDANGQPFNNTGACRSAYRCAEDFMVCQQVIGPTKEVCSGRDDNCDGAVDRISGSDADGTSCPRGQASCGPQECNFMDACVCPPESDCYCGEGLGVEGVRPCPADSYFDGTSCIPVCSRDADCLAGMTCNMGTCEESLQSAPTTLTIPAAVTGSQEELAPQGCSALRGSNPSAPSGPFVLMALTMVGWVIRRRSMMRV